ncbi:hypothetical protein HanRHA438_Chr09g0388921 [Helianthus annuus]|uniref:Uncharacterized protein n=1 Tax=Helianthus annuus TaxID=4232 RepID=A0A251TTE0_HELAN|nr:hypothetical protein HanXRQr2_Chr09g0377351 [Helianthus annuus]KAJ0533290.1 hypothetical protein HanIR_Chr09g0406731 [Helianthus annuus]KAJ0541607.1 hypothetical protein HanHA89_Chr09g0330421 [Helianthus annuus]KAJ0706681.1 hypothetical protein HanLR1_Chr09g0309851 [Helianthus annuus]KAJ0710703.1 hypothetical protein HanOQP8_Chr09g0315431 [Helianthus annuus]
MLVHLTGFQPTSLIFSYIHITLLQPRVTFYTCLFVFVGSPNPKSITLPKQTSESALP